MPEFSAQKRKKKSLEETVQKLQGSPAKDQNPNPAKKSKLSRTNRKNPKVMQRYNVHVPNRLLYNAKGVIHVTGETADESLVMGPQLTVSKFPFIPLQTRRRKAIAARVDPFLADDVVQKACKLRYTLNGGKVTNTLLTKRVVGNGNCLFNALSYVLTGSEKYSDRVRSAICDFIANSKPDDYISKYIADKDYLLKSEMRLDGVWGTETEIIAATQLLQCDILVYTTFQLKDKSYKTEWQRFPFLSSQQRRKQGVEGFPDAIYLENSTMLHYNPVIGFK